MASLRVRDFSCVHSAHLELALLTLIIGPQASGKSVLSKLTYFFYQLLDQPFEFVEELALFDDFSNETMKKFIELFPQTAWGPESFQIEFNAGPYQVKITRQRPRSKNSHGRLRIVFSDFFCTEYQRLYDEIQKAKSKPAKHRSQESIDVPEFIDLSWRLQRAARQRLAKQLGDEYPGNLLFVPAGRSFFTSMRKAVVAFDQAGLLDPLTRQFGRLFLRLRDVPYRSYLRGPSNPTSDRIGRELLGGQITREGDEDFVKTLDGRKIPFSVLSSGQQELLPLWEALNAFLPSPKSIIFIEEPEAHLFPSAQSILVKYLSSFIGKATHQKMLVTTHSPYVLSKLNNLLKAGQIAAFSKLKAQQVEKIISKESWLAPDSTAAYSIDQGILTPIMVDGLIDAQYLDEVSGDISEEFTRLLEVEIA